MPGEQLRVLMGPSAGLEHVLDGDFTVGRNEEGSGNLGNDPEISRRHARFHRLESGEIAVEDLGSTNGTFVNGERIDAPRVLAPGDTVKVGQTTLRFDSAGQATTISPAPDLGAAAAGAGAAAASPPPPPESPPEPPPPPPTPEPPTEPLVSAPPPAAPAAAPAAAATPPGGQERSRTPFIVAGLVAAAVVAVVIVLVSGGSSKKSGSTAAASSPATTAVTTAATTAGTATVTTTPTTTQAASNEAASSTKVTPVGSTLKLGQPAVIAYDDASNHKKGTIEITPAPIQKGSISDFQNIQLTADQKTSTPFYVKVGVKNVGTTDLSGSSPGSYIDGVDDRNQEQTEVIFFGDFPRCDSTEPKQFKAGGSYSVCLTYLIPKGGSLVGMRWTVFDEKTGKSDLNWK